MLFIVFVNYVEKWEYKLPIAPVVNENAKNLLIESLIII